MTNHMKIMNTVMETLKRVTTGMVVDALAISGIQGGIAGIPVESLETFMENIEIMFEVEAGMEQAIRNGAAVEEISKILSKKQYREHSKGE